jgi:hypothetical protein
MLLIRLYYYYCANHHHPLISVLANIIFVMKDLYTKYMMKTKYKSRTIRSQLQK